MVQPVKTIGPHPDLDPIERCSRVFEDHNPHGLPALSLRDDLKADLTVKDDLSCHGVILNRRHNDLDETLLPHIDHLAQGDDLWRIEAVRAVDRPVFLIDRLEPRLTTLAFNNLPARNWRNLIT